MGALTVSEARELWEPAGVYCNTASYGLPPRPAWEALQSALADWHGGRTSWEHWGQSTEGARAAFARLVNVGVERVAVGSTVSELVGSVVTALPARARVVVPDVEFTSTLFPLLVQERLDVRTVAPGRLAEAIGEGADAVAFSAVQMSSGEVADLDALVAAAAAAEAITICDATQALGWLPLNASRFDAVVCGAYKWLMSPRGSAFLTVSERLLERAVPHSAGWYAGEDVHASYFGPPLRLAENARRLDLSPAWFSWVGTEPALEVIERIGVPAIHAHDLTLANRFRAGIGLAPGDSAIVCADLPGAADRLRRAGIFAALRGGRLRTRRAARRALAHLLARLQRRRRRRPGTRRAGLTRAGAERFSEPLRPLGYLPARRRASDHRLDRLRAAPWRGLRPRWPPCRRSPACSGVTPSSASARAAWASAVSPAPLARALIPDRGWSLVGPRCHAPARTRPRRRPTP